MQTKHLGQYFAHMDHSINITYNHQRGSDSKQQFPNAFSLFCPRAFRIPQNLRTVLKYTYTSLATKITVWDLVFEILTLFLISIYKTFGQ